MYADFLDHWTEPPFDSFDCFYYDETGKPCYDLSDVPASLREAIEYPEYCSGTNKFQLLLYRFAARAKAALECGVFEGASTLPLAKGLETSGGRLTCIDPNMREPMLHQRISKHEIQNVILLEGNGLAFRPGSEPNEPDADGIYTVTRPPAEVPSMFDLVYIDSDHTYEHTVRELFLFDQYLNPGGVMILHDIVVGVGQGLIGSKEDYGYLNADAYIGAFMQTQNRAQKIHISDWPVCRPAPNCLMSPIHLAIQSFLAYRPSYSFFKLLDFAGLGIIWKR